MLKKNLQKFFNFALISLVFFFIYWRFVGIDTLYKPIQNFVDNYPIWAGVICIFVGPILFMNDINRYKKEPIGWHKFNCIRSAAIAISGFLLVVLHAV